METIEIRVNVPIDRETEFYRWFADWKDGATNIDSTSAPDSTGETLRSAVAWWHTLTPQESAIWSIWVDAAPSLVTADEIVGALGLKGRRQIPGALAWSSRKGKKVGFAVDWRFRTDPSTGAPIYGIEDADYAALIRQAREVSTRTAPRSR